MAQCNPLKAIFILTCVSLVNSLAIFIFAMVDLGIASWWTNIGVPALTAAYHITILILHRRNRRIHVNQPEDRRYPTSTTASLICAYLLALLWLLPLSLVIGVITMVARERDRDIFVGNMGTFVAQVVLDAAEVGILAAVAGISTKIRLRARKWVPIDDVSFKSESQASYAQANTVDLKFWI